MSVLGKSVVGIDIGGTSAKIAYRNDDQQWQFVSSAPYAAPDRSSLVSAIRDALDNLPIRKVARAGLCLPGRMNADGTAVQCSVNLPVLDGWVIEGLLTEIGISDSIPSVVRSDAMAAGFDWVTEHASGSSQSALRTAAISLGTGVGLCVLDGQIPVGIGSRGIGHLGQIDVGRHGPNDRFDYQGARNTLETYIGLRSMKQYQQGDRLELSGLDGADPPIRALVHSLRLIHAVYGPDQIVLLGGVGLALSPLVDILMANTNEDLTSLARDDWMLFVGETSYHAARGIAKLAIQGSDAGSMQDR